MLKSFDFGALTRNRRHRDGAASAPLDTQATCFLSLVMRNVNDDDDDDDNDTLAMLHLSLSSNAENVG